MGWIVTDKDIIGTVNFKDGRFHNREIKGSYDLVKDFQEHKSKPGGFITVRCPEEGRENRRMRVTVPGKGVGYTIKITKKEPTEDRESKKAAAKSEPTLMSVDEAAVKLGITVDAVRSRVRRGTLESKTDKDGETMVILED